VDEGWERRGRGLGERVKTETQEKFISANCIIVIAFRRHIVKRRSKDYKVTLKTCITVLSEIPQFFKIEQNCFFVTEAQLTS
jgi:hypothetical protein